jgi:hypothetical protein
MAVPLLRPPQLHMVLVAGPEAADNRMGLAFPKVKTGVLRFFRIVDDGPRKFFKKY